MTRSLHKFSLMFLLLTIGMIVKAQDIQEQCLYNTDFTEWEAFSNATAEKIVEKKTAFTNEKLTFSILNNEVKPTGNHDKFKDYVGWIMAAKNADNNYITTSPLASITKVIFTESATGSNRGYKLEVKGDGDSDWVTLYSTCINGTQNVNVNVNRKNCQLRFTNLNIEQNAYLLDLKIYGNVDMSTVTTYSLTTNANPSNGGTVKNTPAGNKYEKDAEVTLTQTPSFGYDFVNWTDGNGNVLGSNESLVVKMTGDMNITANYKAVNTYELALNPTNGAADYMIELSPEPYLSGNKKMYEEGTTVTLTATNNKIFTFTGWSDGTTANSTTVTMNGNQAITANYEAVDYIAGWDFYKSGNNGRNADFFAKSENESASLILRKADGSTASWLDKSYDATSGSGYEGRNAAVNWKTFDTEKHDNFYYQIWVDASEYKDIKVSAEMAYNFIAYTIQKVQYSLDNENWKDLGTITLTGAKVWTEGEFTLPSEADYMPKVYIRWIPDYESPTAGTTPNNDGTAIANIYVLGTSSIQDDGKAPQLVSSIPAEGSSNASATGQIVLTFNEKIQLTENAKATLNGDPISISVVGKTLTASYKKLPYNTAQVFTLEGGSVSDMTNNVLNEAITIHFTTMNKPKVDKKLYDKVVSTVEEFKEALNTANSTKSGYRIFMHNGTYDLENDTLTTISGWNISLIGESMEGTIIVNKPAIEGIGKTATLLNTGQNLYMQDITLKNDYPYEDGKTGRAVCLQDRGNKTIAKRVKLLSYQDTYYSNNRNRFYWEDSEIHGTVDYLCGGGDVYYNRCTFYMEDRNNGDVLAAPNDPLKYGYVFLDCTIDGADSQKGKYNLARPWADQCRAQFINTTMKILPSATGYTEMGDGNAPAVFAEYNSMTSSGSIVDLSGRKTKYIYNEGALVKEAGHSPVLTKEEADALSIDIVMGGSDNWDPRVATEQADAPENVKLTGTSLTWDDNDYVLCWAICKDGAVIDFTTTNSYTVTDTNAKYSVRAANEKGGLSEATEANSSTGIEEVVTDHEVVKTTYYNTAGCQVNAKTKGVIIEVKTLKDGKKKSSKILN